LENLFDPPLLRLAARSAKLAFSVLAFVAVATVARADNAHPIQRDDIDTMFSAMRAQAPWYVDGPLVWGYFFLDPSRAKLEKAAAGLKSRGYHMVDIESIQPGLFKLHVEKIETHTPASLDARNHDLYAVAIGYGIDYDGMDVGPVLRAAKK